MQFNKKRRVNCLMSLAAAALTPATAFAIPVNLELSLVIDVSSSVSSSEYDLQMDGYANAFRDPTIQSNILGGSNGAIGVNTVFFSSNTFTTPLDTFVLLDSASAINGYADTLDGFTRPGSGGTNIQTGINKAIDLLTGDNGFESRNLIIDVSGDGTSSTSATENARDAAAAAGITINGLPIGGEFVTDFYDNSVITSNGFVTAAADFNDFGRAIEQKLRGETGAAISIPEPPPLLLLGTGLMGLAIRRQRHHAA